MSFELNRITWLPLILVSFLFFCNPLINLSNLDGSGGNLGSVKLLNHAAFSADGTISCVINLISELKSFKWYQGDSCPLFYPWDPFPSLMLKCYANSGAETAPAPPDQLNLQH